MTLVLSGFEASNVLTGFHSIQFSVCAGIIFLSTFVPKGSFSFNPKAIEGVRNEQEFEEESSASSIKKSDVEGGRRERDETIIAP